MAFKIGHFQLLNQGDVDFPISCFNTYIFPFNGILLGVQEIIIANRCFLMLYLYFIN